MQSSTNPPATPVIGAAAGDGTAAKGAAPVGKQARIAVALLVLCTLAALFWPRGSATFKEPGGFLFDGEGKATTLGPKLAPVSLVHFWATWCPPCRDEIPSLQRLARDFSQHNDFDIVMVAVADEAHKAKVFLGDWGNMALYDPNWDVAKRYGTDKLPETYLVIRGEVVKKFVGQTDWDDPELRALIASRLRETGAGGAPRPAGS
ncbi:MAG TPA: TlpA disulfide reductase family protein [Thermoanaerobaculia bacterium]|nr:TlpA disulfide reductase family protein [Thermoanaerobaculia bacterium]